MRTPEQSEARKKEIKLALVESYMFAMGLSRPEAEIAAGSDEGKKLTNAFNIVESWGR